MGAMMMVMGSSLSGQSGAILRRGTTEIGGFAGRTFGVDTATAMGGGNISYAVLREVMVLGEFSYFPGVEQTTAVTGIPGATARIKVPLEDFNFGIHFRVPVPGRVIPYGVISFGALHINSNTLSVSVPDPFRPGQFTVTPVPVASSSTYATSFGGGIRFYAGEHYGFRVEAKGYKPTGNVAGTLGGQSISTPLGVFYRVAGGFFYQF
jgi:hypothetical protein